MPQALAVCYEPPAGGVRRARAHLLSDASSGNRVYALAPGAGPGPLILRESRPSAAYDPAAARGELALVRLFAHLGLHPPLEAGSADAAALRLVMARHPDLNAVLETPLAPWQLATLAAQLLALFCAAASLGLCLVDVKPGNFLFAAATARVYVIDLEPAHVSYLDRGLLRLAGARRDRDGCRRARGLLLYLMLLLMYRHLAHRPYGVAAARQQLAARLRAALRRSLVPWAPLAALEGALARQLGRVAQAYFYEAELGRAETPESRATALAWLVDSGRRASHWPDVRSTQVFVNGRHYVKDGVPCDGWAPYDLRGFDARASPCHEAGRAAHLRAQDVEDAEGVSVLAPLGRVAPVDAAGHCPLAGASWRSSSAASSAQKSSSSALAMLHSS